MISTLLDQPWIILIAVAVGLLRWLSQKRETPKQDSQGSQESTSPPPPAIPNDTSQNEEERIRRFLEALGQPKGATPPPKVSPKRATQPRIYPSLPPLTAMPPPLPTASSPAARPPPLPPIERRVFTPAVVQEMEFEVRDIGAQISSDSAVQSRRTAADQRGLITNLATTLGLRSAIVLREIFGPPRSLQPLDSISGF
jgi:hypothetical protein